MKINYRYIVILIGFLLTGCSNNNKLTEENQYEVERLTIEVQGLKSEIKELKNIIATQEKQIVSSENFTYLNDFTEQELQSYDLFISEYDASHLKDFSPEKIVLLFYHSLAMSDLEAVYAITYDGGTLPDFTQFSNDFYSNDHFFSTNEAILSFRNYDAIRVREENQTDDRVAVEIDVNFGTHQAIEIFEVQKENDQWKLILQHLL